MQEHMTALDKLLDFMTAGLLSVFGGSAAYVYKTVREETGFKFSTFLINAFLAFFVGNMVGGLIPKDNTYRDGLLMLAGFSSWPLLAIMEFYGRRAILKILSDKIGVEVDTDKVLEDADKAETKAREIAKEAQEQKQVEEK